MRFSLYSVDSKWFEIGSVEEGTWNIVASNKAEWTEISLRKDRNDVFKLFVNGSMIDADIEAGGNLNEWQLKLASSGTFYTSDVLVSYDVNYAGYAVIVEAGELAVDGKLDAQEGEDVIFTVTAEDGFSLSADNAELVSVEGLVYTFKVENIRADVKVTITATRIPDDILAQSAWSKAGVDGGVIYTEGGYSSTTVYEGSNSNYAGAPLTNLVLSGRYKEIRFAIYAVDNTWWEIGYVKDNSWTLSVSNKVQWIEFRLVKAGDVFQVYRDNELRSGSLEVGSNLNELQMRIGTSGTFYVTEILGRVDPEYGKYTSSVATTPWSVEGASGEEVYENGGYTTTAIYTGSATAYAGAPLTDFALSAKYKEIRFAIYAVSSTWWEIGFINGNTWDLAISNKAQWVEVRLVNEGDGLFKVYRDGELRSGTLEAGSNLNQLQMRLATSGTFYMTDVLGTIDPNFDEFTDIPSKTPWSAKGVEGGLINKDGGYSYATTYSGSNSAYAGAPLIDFILGAEYKEVSFAIYAASSTWWEIGFIADNSWTLAVSNKEQWIEVRFVNTGNGVFEVYRDEELRSGTLEVGSNLNELQMRIGTSGTFYMTEVRARKYSASATATLTATVADEGIATADNKGAYISLLSPLSEGYAITAGKWL